MKFQLFAVDNDGCEYICKGLIEKIFIGGNFVFESENKKEEIKIDVKNHEVAAKLIIDKLISSNIIQSFDHISAIGHRVVHGGEFFNSSTIVNSDSISKIKKCYKLAPLHNPPAITGIEAFQKLIPNIKMTCTFDTSFHTTLPLKNFIYPVPFS